jgi:hypothetical protein
MRIQNPVKKDSLLIYYGSAWLKVKKTCWNWPHPHRLQFLMSKASTCQSERRKTKREGRQLAIQWLLLVFYTTHPWLMWKRVCSKVFVTSEPLTKIHSFRQAFYREKSTVNTASSILHPDKNQCRSGSKKLMTS